MTHDGEQKRPASLVTALALTAFTGAANIIVGGVVLSLLLLGALPKSPGPSSRTLVMIGCAYLVLGALTVLGMVRLLARRPGSRVFLSVVMMLRIAVACISFGVIGTWYSAGSVIGIAVSLVVISLLWDSRANAYFHAVG